MEKLTYIIEFGVLLFYKNFYLWLNSFRLFINQINHTEKNGTRGVLYLTKAPKLVPAIPTPKAKNKENKTIQ